MKISLIAAVGRNNEIGANNDLMWHLPVDMKFFKETTLNHVVIMGRKNYESIPPRFRPFRDRTNFVISRDSQYNAPGCELFSGLEEAVHRAQLLNETEVFIIGGAQIYALALQQLSVTHLYITHVDAFFPQADTFFPNWNEAEWTREKVMEHPADAQHAFGFQIWKYTNVKSS
jgi:dihydrofolate reductase